MNGVSLEMLTTVTLPSYILPRILKFHKAAARECVNQPLQGIFQSSG